jgi:hypothetical protein
MEAAVVVLLTVNNNNTLLTDKPTVIGPWDKLLIEALARYSQVRNPTKNKMTRNLLGVKSSQLMHLFVLLGFSGGAITGGLLG